MELLFIAAVVLLGFWALAVGYRNTKATLPRPRYSRKQMTPQYADSVIAASKALYDFLVQLSYNPRCVQMLRSLPGLEKSERAAKGSFTINPRLALLALCDARDCYLKLGNSLSRLESQEGLGLVALACLLLQKNANLELLRNPQNAVKFAEAIKDGLSERYIQMKISGGGFDDEFRFGIIFGIVHDERDWVRRYSTLMYRWASLMAKADGTITEQESTVLARIMNMSKLDAKGCNVHIAGDGDDGSDAASINKQANASARKDVTHGGRGLEETLAALDALIGLRPVKDEVKKLTNFIQIQEKRKLAGLKSAPISRHCVFTGNPGTGKTTVARILADIYRELGIVKKGHLVETDRSGLIGEYVGQTAAKTNKVIDSALDGILFIDEAYSLIHGGQNDYGREAIATLLKRMEDDRDRFAVILAGYTEEMKDFIESNPGLRSRFNRYIFFPDYSADELASIFLAMAEKSQYSCDADVRASIRDIMKHVVSMKDRNFGNARYVRNLFESAIERQAVRLSAVAPLTTEMLAELTLHDLGFKYDD